MTFLGAHKRCSELQYGEDKFDYKNTGLDFIFLGVILTFLTIRYMRENIKFVPLFFIFLNKVVGFLCCREEKQMNKQ